MEAASPAERSGVRGYSGQRVVTWYEAKPLLLQKKKTSKFEALYMFFLISNFHFPASPCRFAYRRTFWCKFACRR